MNFTIGSVSDFLRRKFWDRRDVNAGTEDFWPEMDWSGSFDWRKPIDMAMKHMRSGVIHMKTRHLNLKHSTKGTIIRPKVSLSGAYSFSKAHFTTTMFSKVPKNRFKPTRIGN